jgi:hypothetical protein
MFRFKADSNLFRTSSTAKQPTTVAVSEPVSVFARDRDAVRRALAAVIAERG